MQEILSLGKKVYRLEYWCEARRYVVFVGRSMLHRSAMKNVYAYFKNDEIRRKMLEDFPFFIEQITRAFFYKGSTFQERKTLLEGHIGFLCRTLKDEKLRNYPAPFRIWQAAEEASWYCSLMLEPGQRKEGLWSVMMRYADITLYQIMFWIARDKQGEYALWIGAMQGPNVEDSKELIKKVTKASFGYRTKNLILYMTRVVARSMGLNKMYAVTNGGYYANNHVRIDRKLKTDFSSFWEEAGGTPTDDERFYALPLLEKRKTMEEVPTRKRAVYRKRFVFLDEVEAEIEKNMKKILR